VGDPVICDRVSQGVDDMILPHHIRKDLGPVFSRYNFV
jgi:hypothetical protein